MRKQVLVHEIRCPHCNLHLFNVESLKELPFDFSLLCPSCLGEHIITFGDWRETYKKNVARKRREAKENNRA
jgi:hypothetical protein